MVETKWRYVGERVSRVDGLDKVTGQAVYGFDLELPGMLFGAAARSPIAHGKIVEIDVSEAMKVPGVKAVVTGKDFPFTFGFAIRDQPFMATERVRYVGEPVAAVAAETEAAAQEAAARVRVKYEELPAVFDPREAMNEGAPLLHPDLEKYPRTIPPSHLVPGTNICTFYTYKMGDMEAGFREADEIFEDEFGVHAVSHGLMETHAAIAQYSSSRESYTLWASTDRPFFIAKELADGLGIPLNRIRFVVPYVGGSFGGKSSLIAEAIAVALARFTKGRPVKVIFSREEELTVTGTRMGAYIKLKTGVKKDGTLIARRAEIVWDNGAYTANAPGVATRGAITIFGPYRTPNVELISRLVYTNKEVSRSYRGFGTTQVSWACEIQMDIIATRLGMDPLEFRLKNGWVEGDQFINGQVIQEIGLKETIRKAGQEIGWGEKKELPLGSKRRGKGMASMLKGTATPTSSCCSIRVDNDGSVTILAGSPEIGGGQKTILAQIAADTIGVPFSSVFYTNPDTQTHPFDNAVGSSRTTFHMGNAIRMAGQEVRQKILEIAGAILETDPARLSLSEGKIFQEGVGERMTLGALLTKKSGGRGAGVFGEAHYNPADSSLLNALPGRKGISSIFWMYATHAAEVEVDIETGVVKVLKIAAAHDMGQPINPLTCEQQIEGGVIMGVSNALFEELKMEKGRILNATLADYKLATMLDLPKIVPIIVKTYHREGPFGAKGIGEPVAAATSPAIANAIHDAVGIWIKDLPITPEKVLAALRKKESGVA